MSDLIWKTEHLMPYLKKNIDTDRIYIHQCLMSTNDTAKLMAKEGCAHGTVVLSDKQTAGRGRFNRSFYSPEGTGLYMSIILDADKLCLDEYTLLTPLVAVVTSKVIDSVAGKKCGIKWVNDLYLEEKKVCGILTEGVMNRNDLSKFVVGIGINIGTSEFPEEIENIAGALINQKDIDDMAAGFLYKELEEGISMEAFFDYLRNRIAAGLINELLSEEIFKEATKLMEEYRANQILNGKVVTVLDAKESYEAKVLDVDTRGRLMVERTAGEFIGRVEILNSGEVSIKRR